MKKRILAAALSLPLLASAQNLLTNGSFELGLTGWSTTDTPGTIYPISAVTYNSLPGAFGEIVPPDNAAGNLSPDAVGTQAAYFVDDQTTQVLSQSFTIASDGQYNYGLSLYVPANGAANPGEASFSILLATGALVTTIGVLPTTTWLSATNSAFLPAGTYVAQFTFSTLGGESKDVLIDRVYVTAVPEPGTLALLLAGLGIVAMTAARRRRD